MITKMYRTRNLAVTATQKSQATMAARVIAQKKRAPVLITARSAAWLPSHVLAHRARRDSNAELDQQFVRDPLLAP